MTPHRTLIDRAGTSVGKYQLVRLIGRGGMGAVYEGRDRTLQRDVAVKLIPAEPEHVPRFLREARTAARVSHPNVVTIFDVGKADGVLFIVMELIRGVTAQGLVAARGPLPWETATQLLLSIGRGLQAAHREGLIHRDIKPANLLCPEGHEPQITDFGLAKPTDGASHLTHAGTIVGTPEYMSPEQCRGESVDERTDIYSLGAVFFFLLTGRPPFVSADRLTVLFHHCSTPLPDLRTLVPGLPASCIVIIEKALSKKRTDRYPTVAAFMEALESLGTGPHAALTDTEIRAAAPTQTVVLPPKRRRRMMPIVALTGFGLAVIAVMGFTLKTTLAHQKPSVPSSTVTKLSSVEKSNPKSVATVESEPPRSGVSWFDSSFQLQRQWHLHPPTSVKGVSCYLPNDRHFLTAYEDRKLAVWQPPAPRFSTIDCGATVRTATSLGRSSIAVGTDDNVIRFFNQPDGRSVAANLEIGERIDHLVARGTWLAVATASGLRMYDLKQSNSPTRATIRGPVGIALTTLAFAPEGLILAGLNTNHQLDTWKLVGTEWALSNRVNLPAGESIGLAFGPTPRQITVLGRTDNKPQYFLFERPGESTFRIVNGPDDATAIATLATGRGIAFAGRERLGVFDPSTTPPSIREAAQLPASSIVSLTVSRDGRRCICGLSDGKVVTFDADAPIRDEANPK